MYVNETLVTQWTFSYVVFLVNSVVQTRQDIEKTLFFASLKGVKNEATSSKKIGI